MRFWVRKASRRGKTGNKRWIVYDGQYFSGLTIEQDGFFKRGHYMLLRNDEFQKLFPTLQAAGIWLNQSELERIVSAIG